MSKGIMGNPGFLRNIKKMYHKYKLIKHMQRVHNHNVMVKNLHADRSKHNPITDNAHSRKKNLKSHTCYLCEYNTTRPVYLRIHQENKHEGIKYSCDQCELQGSGLPTVKRHQEIKNEGLRYSCGDCEYQGAAPTNLKCHQESQH